MSKHSQRIRRARKSKNIIRLSGRPRLVVFRSCQHIYGQIVVGAENGDKIVVSSSSLDREIKSKLSGKKKVDQATEVGKLLAKRAKDNGISEVAFDRNGFKYHGRVKALAEAAREEGMNF